MALMCVFVQKKSNNTSTDDFKLFAAQMSTDLILPLFLSSKGQVSPALLLKTDAETFGLVLCCACVFLGQHILQQLHVK